MLDKFSGRMSMTNGKRLADLSPQKSNKKHSPLMRLRMWQNSKNNFCFLKISPRIMPEVPNIEGKKGTLKHVAQLQLQLQRTTFDQHPLWKKSRNSELIFSQAVVILNLSVDPEIGGMSRGAIPFEEVFLGHLSLRDRSPTVKHQVPGRGLPVDPLQPHWVNR